MLPLSRSHKPVKRIIADARISRTRAVLKELRINTVCDHARCPNLAECFARGHFTFLLLGTVCTRYCRFCASAKGVPQKPDYSEIERVAAAIERLKLDRVVLTSVSRDDLPDGGASYFAAALKNIRRRFGRSIRVETLVPDFAGKEECVRLVAAGGPDIFAHNMETVRRLYPLARPQADYERSLGVLKAAKRENSILTKSGIMLGLKERREEVMETLGDLRGAGCDIVVIGQYLRPDADALPVAEYAGEAAFAEYERAASALGFRKVYSGTFARSSYLFDDDGGVTLRRMEKA